MFARVLTRPFRRGDLVADANERHRRVVFVGPADSDGAYRVGLLIPGAPRPKFVGSHEIRLVEESQELAEKIVATEAERSPPRAEPKRDVPAAAMPHQREGIAWLEEHPSAILADQPGLGKTLTTIASLDAPALVICPAVMKAEWADEVQRWRPGLSTMIITGTKPLAAAEYTRADVTIVNYDIVAAHEPDLTLAHAQRPFRTLVADEAHGLKTLAVQRRKGGIVYSGSSRAEAVARLCRMIPRRIMVSATPVLNRPIELFPLLHMIDPHEWGDYVEYGKRYCAGFLDSLVAKGGRRVKTWNFTGASNTEELHAALASKYMLRRTKDVLTLPSKTRETIEVAMDREVAAEYAVATHDFLSWVEQSGGPKAVLKARRAEQLAKMVALRGLAAKGKIGPAVRWMLAHQARGRGPLVVMAHHVATIDGLEQALLAAQPSLRIGRIVGGQSDKRRKADKEAFQAGQLDVILCSIMAAGVGLTLTRASETLFVERSWRPMDLVQAEDRIHRIGQTRPVTITYMDAKGTIDVAMSRVLLGKTATIAGVIEGEAIDEQEAARRVFGIMCGQQITLL